MKNREVTMSKKPTVEEAFEELMGRITRRAPLREVSIAYVHYALACFDNNKVVTARQIGVDRRSIQRWMRGGSPGAKRSLSVVPAAAPQPDGEPLSGVSPIERLDAAAPSSVVVETPVPSDASGTATPRLARS